MMNTLPDNEMWLYRFLLDELPPAEMESLEIRLLTDDELQTQVAAAEFDLIDDYQRGALTVAEHTRFEQHFLNSPDRRSKLMTAQAFLDTATMPAMIDTPNNVTSIKDFVERKAAQPKRTWKFPLALAASFLLLVSLSAVIYRVFFSASPAEQGLALLQRAYRNERPLEARVSGFDYAPFVQTRGANDDNNNNGILREQAASELRRAVIDKPSAGAQHALGNYYLLESKFADALKQLEESLKTDPNNAQLHNDLGVALLETAKLEKQQAERGGPTAGESLKTLARANEHFAQALQIDGTLLAAQFNQALCLGYLGLVTQAMEAWQKYLQLDATSEWANEARRKLAELEEQRKKTAWDKERLWQDFLAAAQANDDERIWETFSASWGRVGNAITERLLDEYLELSVQARNVEAAQKLSWLARAGALEAQRSGELYTRDLAQFYQRTNPEQRRLLADARAVFKDALVRNHTSFSEGCALYQQAGQLFVQAGNEDEARVMDYLVGIMHVRMSEYEQGRQVAEKLIKYVKPRSYLWLQARALETLADLSLSTNDYFRAVHYSQRALALAEQAHDWNETTMLLVQLSDGYLALGDDQQAFRWATRALEVAGRYPLELQWRWTAYSTAQGALARTEYLFTAVVCGKEALQTATEMNRPLNQSRSLDKLGEIYGRLKNYGEGIKQVEQALAIGTGLADRPLAENIKTHALLRLGNLHREAGQWEAALNYYNEGVRLSEQRQIVGDSFNAHYGRLLVYLAQRDNQQAEAELARALALFESNRAKIRDESLRSSFFETGQDVYDLAIRFFADHRHNTEQAFNYAEQGRARSLLDLLQREEGKSDLPAAAKPLTLPEIKRQLPPALVVVEYAVLPEALHIWTVSATAVHHTISAVTRDELQIRVGDYLKALANPTETGLAQQRARELYEALIRPIEAQLAASQKVCFVPDKALNYLSFAALIEPASGKYLVEQYTITYAPSATAFLAATQIAQHKQHAVREQCLSVGNPAFDQRQFPTLPDLLLTSSEATRVAGYYPQRILLLSGAAREGALRDAMPQSEVIHIASHGLVNEQRPELSGVLLADESDNPAAAYDGLLQAREVSQMNLPRTKLVVLSACQTWLGRNYRGEGMMGLGRAFIAAGVPLVVASLWPVPTGETGELMYRFHWHRTQGKLSTVQALRQAQLDLLKHADPHYHAPSAWAGFIVVGGHASF